MKFYKKRLLVLILITIIAAGCTEVEIEVEPEPSFAILSYASDQIAAQSNQTVTLSWSYEEPEGGELAFQQIRFLRLTFLGVGEVQDGVIELPTEERSFTFAFNGPVTIELLARNVEGDVVSAALTVKAEEEHFFRMTATRANFSAPSLGDPYIVTAADSPPPDPQPVTIEFTQFIAFWDRNQNQLVDAVHEFLDNEREFRAYSYYCENGADNYCWSAGALYPFLDPNDLFKGNANGMIYGGAIAYSGNRLSYKANDGEGEARVVSGQIEYSYVFLAIALQYLPISNELQPVDYQLGNMDQGLITTVYRNQSVNTTLGEPAVFDLLNPQTTGATTSGYIKGAMTGLVLTPSNGDLIYANIFLDNVEWNMSFLPDTEIDNYLFFAPGVP